MLCARTAFPGFSVKEVFRAHRSDTRQSDTRPSCPTLHGEPQGPATPVLLLDRPPPPSWKAGGAAASGAEGRAVEGARAQGACSGRAAVLCLRAGHGEKGCCGHLLVSYHGDQGPWNSLVWASAEEGPPCLGTLLSLARCAWGHQWGEGNKRAWCGRGFAMAEIPHL